MGIFKDMGPDEPTVSVTGRPKRRERRPPEPSDLPYAWGNTGTKGRSEKRSHRTRPGIPLGRIGEQ